MKIKKIDWLSKQRDQIEHVYGSINGVNLFTIVRFRTDPYIMTSYVIPMPMKKGDDLKKLKNEASKELKQFVTSVTIVNYKDVIRK